MFVNGMCTSLKLDTNVIGLFEGTIQYACIQAKESIQSETRGPGTGDITTYESG